MATDTTTVSTNAALLAEVVTNFFAAKGLETNDGDFVFQIANATNTAVTRVGTLGWFNVGALKAKPKIGLNQEYVDLETGFVKRLLRKFRRGVSLSVPLEIMCPTYFGLQFLFDTTDVSLTEPDTPVSTTVDTSTAPTRKVLKLNSVSSLEVGQRIAVTTGESDKNPTWETKHIKSIDSSASTVTLEQPLEFLPENGATFKVIKSVLVEKKNNFLGTWQGRLVQYHKDGSVAVFHIPLIDLAKPDVPGGNGQDPDEASIEIAGLADWDVDANGNIESDYFSWEQIYDTTPQS